ncbi:MAG TPA: hypothetical protein VEB42_07885, partial [Chitinophagaceae bacterium]|nr:hypothetical protein [Chitinophagaceae bacterium]
MTANDFAFSPNYRLQRHILYWFVYLVLWACYWTMVHQPFPVNFLKMVLWLPVFVLYSYPLAFYAVPKWLLRGKYLPLIAGLISWGIFGWYLNIYFRQYVFFPVFNWLHLEH